MVNRCLLLWEQPLRGLKQYWRVNHILFLLILQCVYVVNAEQFKITLVGIAEM